jgi:hypothetical protein
MPAVEEAPVLELPVAPLEAGGFTLGVPLAALIAAETVFVISSEGIFTLGVACAAAIAPSVSA